MTHHTNSRKPLRILLISNHRRFKINFRAYPWARELAARGHHVDVMCHANAERWRTKIDYTENFRIIENPDLMVGALRQGWDPVCALRRRNFLFRENQDYDIIHCLDTRLAVVLPALAYARKKNIMILSDWIDWWGRGGLIKERRPWWYRYLFAWVETFFEEHYRNKLDGLSAISQALIERAVKLGVPRARCLWIPGGSNNKACSQILSKEENKHKLGITASTPVVCFSGLDVLIDLPLVIKAYKLIRDIDSRTILLLIGPTKASVKKLVNHNSTLLGIKATGPIPYEELPQYLAAADVFVMPYTNKISNIGRWPNKIGDYMCIGRPTVSNPVGEVKWLYEKYDVGLLAEENPESIAAAVTTLLNSPDLADKIGRMAREVAITIFAWDKLIIDLENWYYKLLNAKKAEN